MFLRRAPLSLEEICDKKRLRRRDFLPWEARNASHSEGCVPSKKGLHMCFLLPKKQKMCMYVLHMYACIFLCLQRHGLYLQPITKNCSGMVSAYEVLLHACTSLYGDMYVCILRRLCSFEEGTVMHYIFPRYCHASCSWMMYCLKTF